MKLRFGKHGYDLFQILGEARIEGRMSALESMLQP